MKKEIAEFVARCLVCQRVKIEHQTLVGLMQRIELPELKWEHITMDFVVGLPVNQKGNDAIWAIVHSTPATVFALWHGHTYRKLSGYKGYLSLSFQIETQGLLPAFGGAFKKQWGHN